MPLRNIAIKKIEIKKFGKFEDHSVNLEKGLNVIYGQNESGKSTLQLFLKVMLYGIAKQRKSAGSVKERDQILPWSGGRAEGVLTVEADGLEIEIFRQFGKTSASDKLEVRNAVTGEVLPELNSENVGELLFGIPRGIFEKTFWIGQSAVYMGGRDDELSKRLANLKTTGDETVSANTALEKLNTMLRKYEAKDRRNNKGELDILRERLEECKIERYDLATQLAQTESTRELLADKSKQLKETEAKIVKLEADYKKSIENDKIIAIRERVEQIDECDKKIELIHNNYDYQRSEGLDSEIVQNTIELERELSELEAKVVFNSEIDIETENVRKKQQSANIVTGVGIALAAMGAAAFAIITVIVGFNLLSAFVGVIAAAGVCALCIGIKKSAVCKRKLEALEKERLEAEKQRNETLEKKFNLKAELDKIYSQYNVESSSELSRLYNFRAGQEQIISGLIASREMFLGNNSYEELTGAITDDDLEPVGKSEDIEAELKNMRDMQVRLVADIKSLDSKMAYDVKITKIPADIETEINYIKNEIKRCKHKIEIIKEAEAGIKAAAENWQTETMPQLNKITNSILNVLTNGKYNGIRVTEDYKMRLASQSGLFDAELFSTGTYEQMYLSLRLAAAELMEDCKILFMDDVLTSYDDERSEAALELFSEMAKEWQILLFTCHKFVYDKADIHSRVELIRL